MIFAKKSELENRLGLSLLDYEDEEVVLILICIRYSNKKNRIFQENRS